MEPIRLILLPELCTFSQKHLLNNFPEEKLSILGDVLTTIENLESSFTLRLISTAKYRLYLAVCLLSVLFAFTVIVPILGTVSILTLICCPQSFYSRLVQRVDENCAVAIKELNSVCKPSIVATYEIILPGEPIKLEKGSCLRAPNITISLLFKRNSQWVPMSKSLPMTGVPSSKKRILTASQRRIEAEMSNHGPHGSQRSLSRSKSRRDYPSDAGRISVAGILSGAEDPEISRRIKVFVPIVSKLCLIKKVYSAAQAIQNADLSRSDPLALSPLQIDKLQAINLKAGYESLQKLSKNDLADAYEYPVAEDEDQYSKEDLFKPQVIDFDQSLPLLPNKKQSTGRDSNATPNFGKNHDYPKLRLFAVQS